MKRIDLHPEGLLDRARRGEASEDDLARLRAHLEVCAACRFEFALSRQLDAEAEHLFLEERTLRRVHAATLRTVAARETRDRPERSLGGWRWPIAGAAGGAVIAVVGAAAALAGTLLHPARSDQRHAPPVEATSARSVPTQGAGRVSHRPPPASPSASDPETRPALSASSERGDPRRLTAGEMFARANAARRSGEAVRAVELYRELQRAFPGSSEASLSRVTLGRLLLDRLGDPRGALGQFESYIASAGRGSLREEALVGRALALARLGRHGEEREAWRALLAYNPRSTYAEHAQARLQALDPEPVGSH